MGLSIAVLLAFCAACSTDDVALSDKEYGEAGTGRGITVAADIAQQLYSRAGEEGEYIDEGPVKNGIYYMTYLRAPQSNYDNYNVAEVDFHKNEEFTPGIGMVTVTENGKTEGLKWDDVGGGATPTFFLDNVKPELATTGSTKTEIVFDLDKRGEIPYKAAIFDSIHGRNDLLWGSKVESRGTKTINFDLHHYMSRVKVHVTVDKTNEAEEGDLDISKATVEISSINQYPLSFNRLDGSLKLDSLNEDESNYGDVYSTLTLVDKGNGWIYPNNSDGTVDGDTSDDDTTGDSENGDAADKKKEVYITQDFVLPPQGLLTNERRPRLTIKLENGRVYSGILPHAMEIYDENQKEVSFPATLYFLKEHILTIRTIITEEPPELKFMPVWVVEWVDKGEFSLEAHQAGIYTAQEFYSLIGYYNGAGLDDKTDESNEYQLSRYGQFNMGSNVDGQESKPQWNFDFFRSVTLDYDEIHGNMVPVEGKKNDFTFNYNGYSVSINRKNTSTEPKPVSPDMLRKIVMCTKTNCTASDHTQP